MRILFLQQQPCMRAMKYAVALRAARPDWRLAFAYQGKTLTEWYGSGDELFERWWDLGEDPRKTLARALAEFRPHVAHSHNLPDSLTVLANELAGGRIPVVHDVHDLQSLRVTPYENGFPEPADALGVEKRAIEESAAIVAVSDEQLAEIRARYRVPAHAITFANYALRRDLPAELPPPARLNGHRPRLVYQGTLSTNGGHYDLRELFRSLVLQGTTLDIYPSREVPEYRELAARTPGMRYHDTVDPERLLAVLPDYDYGWAGFNDGLNRAHVDTALPNKLYEYVGCGVPVLTLPHRALARFVEETGVGATLTTVDDLGAQLAELDLAALRRRAAAARFKLTVEANIERVANLYEDIVGS